MNTASIDNVNTKTIIDDSIKHFRIMSNHSLSHLYKFCSHEQNVEHIDFSEKNYDKIDFLESSYKSSVLSSTLSFAFPIVDDNIWYIKIRPIKENNDLEYFVYSKDNVVELSLFSNTLNKYTPISLDNLESVQQSFVTFLYEWSDKFSLFNNTVEFLKSLQYENFRGNLDILKEKFNALPLPQVYYEGILYYSNNKLHTAQFLLSEGFLINHLNSEDFFSKIHMQFKKYGTNFNHINFDKNEMPDIFNIIDQYAIYNKLDEDLSSGKSKNKFKI